MKGRVPVPTSYTTFVHASVRQTAAQQHTAAYDTIRYATHHTAVQRAGRNLLIFNSLHGAKGALQASGTVRAFNTQYGHLVRRLACVALQHALHEHEGHPERKGGSTTRQYSNALSDWSNPQAVIALHMVRRSPGGRCIVSSAAVRHLRTATCFPAHLIKKTDERIHERWGSFPFRSTISLPTTTPRPLLTFFSQIPYLSRLFRAFPGPWRPREWARRRPLPSPRGPT